MQKRLYFLVHRFDNMEEMKDFYEGDEEMIGMVSDMENHVGAFDDILRYDRNKWCFEEGRTEGRDEGMLLAARNLLANGASDELILNSTNITKEQLIELKNELKANI